MPVTLKTGNLKYKKSNGQYEGIGAIGLGNITETVEDWMDENLSNPDSPPLDRSLTLSAAAAPADLVGEIKNAVSDIEDELFVGGNLLDVSDFYSNNNNAVTNNGDGTFTFGTTDRGTTCWESIGNVPAGNYELIGLPSSASGWTYVSTEASVSSGVITNNSSSSNVSYTNPTEQKLYILVYLRSNPSDTFTLKPEISGGKQSVLDSITESINDINDYLDEINGDGEASNNDIGKALIIKEVADGKVSAWEYGETGSGADDIYVDIANEYKPEYTVNNSKRINTSTGAIENATSSENVLAFPVEGCGKFRMQASSYGGASGAYYAFYTAETFAECGTSTLVGTTHTYNRTLAIYDYEVPAEAKFCCVYISSVDYISCVKITKGIKGYTSIADEYDPENGKYQVGEFVNHDGLSYQCIVPINTAEVWDASHWIPVTVKEKIEQITSENNNISQLAKFQVGTINSSSGAIETNIKYRIATVNLIFFKDTTDVFIADGYGGMVFYYEADGTYTGVFRNIAATQYHYNTIPAGSYVKFYIEVTGQTTTLTDLDIPGLSDKITFKSEYAKQSEQVKENSFNVSNGMAARMYEKGASQKSFSHAVGILCAGQSNIAGVLDSSTIPSSITFPMSNIKYSRSNTPTTFDDGISSTANWGVDLSLFDALNKLGSGDTFYGIKYAAPGTGIDTESSSEGNERWTAYYERLSSIDKSLLYKLEEKIRTLGALNPNTYDVRALIWHQGENDSTFSNSGNVAIPNRYYENFKCVIAYIRGVVGNERLPVIYGTISHESIAYDPIIEAAQWRIAQEDPNVYCIDMSGAELKDDYHFNPASAVYFGQKAFDALIDFGVIEGTKIDPSRPWGNT